MAPLGLSPAAQAFRQSVEDLLQQNNLLSGSSPKSLFLLIFDVNGARQEWAYGDRTDNGSRIPPDRFTVYSIGSVSKVFTATVVAELILEGRVELDKSINAYLPPTVQLPKFRRPDGTDVPITVRHRLQHVSGDSAFCLNHSNPVPGIVDLANCLSIIRPYFFASEPGMRWKYSDYHYLGALIENVDGRPLFESFYKRILLPSDMRMTGHEDFTLAADPDNIARPIYQPLGGLFDASGSLRSNADDMMRFGLSALRHSSDPALNDAMQYAQENYLGWNFGLATRYPASVYLHNGTLDMQQSFFAVDLMKGIGFIALTGSNNNTEGGDVTNRLAGFGEGLISLLRNRSGYGLGL